jgi:nicotinate (nicotinamide) nucleotide adenylyltransferase
MDESLRQLAERVRRSHDQHFHHTALPERTRDLARQVSELVHHRDRDHLVQELGDAGWSLLQLCTELGVDLTQAVDATIQRLDRKAAGKKVALLGTSANPITNAHLTLALEVLALTDVDEVWLYLAGEHPWGKKLMPAHHRLEMVQRAVARYPRLKVCDFDIVHGPRMFAVSRETSYVLQEHFLPAFPTYEFTWIMGSDVARTFHEWGGADWLAANLRVVIVHRLGYDFDPAGTLLAGPRHLYLRDNIVTSNISSTLVRERGRTYDGDRLLALVPEVVWDYLVEHRLLDEGVLR